jgi:exodeoxyribonuclease V alpha subunit
VKFDTIQLEAIERAVAAPFHIINGAAGCGKTTIIREITDRLTERGESVALCAFAGKAAARLREATGYEASTVHRMLGYNGTQFMRGTLAGTTVILDEASMVASDLMAELVKRNPARLVLVGDQAQLPPVGKGQPFHDLLALMTDKVTTLRTCYRNKEAVYHNAMQIREGIMPSMFEQSEQERWSVLQTGEADKTHAWVLNLVRKGGVDFDQDIILVPRNGETADAPCTVEGLNKAIVDIVNPRMGGEKLLVGDRVICGKNFSEEDVWNGTTGKVCAMDTGGCAWVHLDTPCLDVSASSPDHPVYRSKVLFSKEMMKHLSLAYALTVHKAQGSSYRNVLFVCLGRDVHSLLDRSLVYTAVTRTREKCCVVGQKNALFQAIGLVRPKRTVIQEICA